MDQTEGTTPVTPRAKQIAMWVLDDKKFQLLKNIAKTVTKMKEPKKNCKHCYGRGFIGYYNGLKSSPVKCRCCYVRPILGMRKDK